MKEYVGCLVLGLFVGMLLRTGCSTTPEEHSKYILKTDTLWYEEKVDSIDKLIHAVDVKKNPLLIQHKAERERADSVITVYVADSLCQEDTLIDLLYRERQIADSILFLYRRDSLLLKSKIKVLMAKDTALSKELGGVGAELVKTKAELGDTKRKLKRTKRWLLVCAPLLAVVLAIAL